MPIEEGSTPVPAEAAAPAEAAQTPADAPAPVAENAPAPAAEPAKPAEAEQAGLNDVKADAIPESKEGSEYLGAPADGYSDEGFSLPEGVEFPDGISESLAQTCSKLGISQKGFAEIVNQLAPAMEAQKKSFIQEYRTEAWKSAQQDPEIGGAKFRDTMNAAKPAFDKFCPDELKEILAATGLDCHPAVIKLFYGISQQLSQDAIHRGTGSQAPAHSAASFFNNSKMN